MLYKKKSPILVFVLPSFLLMAIFLYYPFVQNIINSIYDIRGLAAPRSEFLGLSNYARFFKEDTVAMTAFTNTLKIMGLTLIFQIGIALVLALMVDAIKKGQQFFRMVYFFPIVISATAIGLMFNLFYKYDGGMLNQLMHLLGKDNVLWLSKETAFTMVVIPTLWQYIGFYFVILLTGLSGIPQEIYESAEMDGATGLKKIRYITLPLLSDVLLTCITLAVTGAIKVFDLPAVIVQNGAPNGLTYFLGTYMHNQTFVAQNVDYGSAIAVIIVLVGVIVAQVLNRLMSRSTSALR